jgi:hypothetical protein
MGSGGFFRPPGGGLFFFFGERIEEGGGLERQREGGLELKGGRERWERGKPLSHLPLPPRPRPPSPCGPSIPSNSLSPFLFPPLPPRILFFFGRPLAHFVFLPSSLGEVFLGDPEQPPRPIERAAWYPGLALPPSPPPTGERGKEGPEWTPPTTGPARLGEEERREGKESPPFPPLPIA